MRSIMYAELSHGLFQATLDRFFAKAQRLGNRRGVPPIFSAASKLILRRDLCALPESAMGHVQTMVSGLINLASWSLVPSRADLLPLATLSSSDAPYTQNPSVTS